MPVTLAAGMLHIIPQQQDTRGPQLVSVLNRLVPAVQAAVKVARLGAKAAARRYLDALQAVLLSRPFVPCYFFAAVRRLRVVLFPPRSVEGVEGVAPRDALDCAVDGDGVAGTLLVSLADVLTLFDGEAGAAGEDDDGKGCFASLPWL